MSGLKFPRRSLLLAGASLLACDGAAPKAGALGFGERLNERVQGWLFSPDKLAPDPGEAALTPERAFPVYHVAPGIPLPPAGWVLKVGGAVKQPLALSLEDLTKLTRTDIRVRHHCVEGWSAVASWHGVQLRELARIVGADAKADYVELRSFDVDEDGVPYSSSWDRASALHPQSLIAWGFNGGPLGPERGGPARLYSPVKLGYKLVKYLTEVNFLTTRTGGYWEDQGYEWFAGT